MKKIILLCLIGYAGCVSAMIPNQQPNQQVARCSYTILELCAKNTEAIRTLLEKEQPNYDLIGSISEQNRILCVLLGNNTQESLDIDANDETRFADNNLDRKNERLGLKGRVKMLEKDIEIAAGNVGRVIEIQAKRLGGFAENTGKKIKKLFK